MNLKRFLTFFQFQRVTIEATGLAMLWLVAVSDVACADEDGIRVESFVSEASPYVQQTIVYTVRVRHGLDVSEINPAPLEGDGFAIERVDGPPSTSRLVGTGGMMTSDFRYAVTPLSVGRLVIPSLRLNIVSQEHSAGPWRPRKSERKETQLWTDPVPIQVPAAAAAQRASWLPLYGLRLSGHIDRQSQLEVGEPVVLTLVQTGWGRGGGQLPSLVSYVDTPDFKVYLEETETSQAISANGRIVKGERKETYTLIPQRSGSVAIPAIRVPWWNLYREQADASEWPGLHLAVVSAEGLTPESGVATPSEESASARKVVGGASWLGSALLVCLSFVAGWWLRGTRVASGVHRLGRRVVEMVRGAIERVRARLAANRKTEALGNEVISLGTRLHASLGRAGAWLTHAWPALGLGRPLSGLRGDFLERTPLGFQTWLLSQQIQEVKTPGKLEALLRKYAHHALGLSPQASLQAIRRAWVASCPRLNNDELETLFATLEDSLYGGKQEFVAEQWQRAFKAALRRGQFYCRRERRRRLSLHTLPELNPGYSK